jgi:uncharacterized protein involved in response to NO
MLFFNSKAPIWCMGFRPFFILVLLTALATTPVWVLTITGLASFDFSPLTPNQWHANEMLFGFLVAAVIGFLLTASSNWTGTRGIHGIPLMVLTVLFFFVRVIFWTTPFESFWIYQMIGVLVPVFLLVHLARLFIKTKNTRNLILLVPLSAIVYGQIGILGINYELGLELSLYAVRFLVIVIAGRVIPLFTKRSLKLEPKWNQPLFEKTTILTALLLIFEPFFHGTSASTFGAQVWVGLTTVALFLNLFRIINWRFFQAFKNRILFILYLAYLWLPVHFAFALASHFGWIDEIGRPALHSLAFGCMGVMILGIVHRVSLGHTGRLIQASTIAQFAYFSIALGALVRVFGPLAMPEYYLFWIKVSGTLWFIAFAVFSVEILPVLMGPRADGKEY